jgi:phytoene dehydrogenase-like protein
MLFRLEGMNGSRTAVVVGGGPAGLMAAGRLAEGGFETLLLEAGPHLGGRAASEVRGGFVLNQGPHALYVGGPAGRELKASGIELDWWQPASAASVFPREGKPKRTLGGSAQLGRWFLRLQRTDPRELADISTSEWLRQSLRSERARASAAALVRVTTFVADQESLSAEVAATQLKIGLLPGVRYLRGGWQQLVDALDAKAEAAGATLRTRAAVRALDREPEKWALSLDGETLRADVVVLAAGGPDAATKLLGDRAPAAPGPAAELSVLDLGLRSLPRRSRRFALGVDKPTYLSRHSPPEHRDGVLLTLASYAREPRAALEELADEVQPGWREEVMLERFLPRMVAVSAIATAATGGLSGRPGIDRGDGLYLAGDWIGGEGWLVDAALASAATAAAAALSAPMPLAA